MKKFNDITEKLLQLDKTGNIRSIELQSDTEGSVEINVIYDDFDTISEELWDYTLSASTPGLHIDNFGADQEIPHAREVLYKREG